MAEREKVLVALTRNRNAQRDQLQLEPTARTFVPKEASEPANPFERPKSVSGPKSVPRPSGSGPERPNGIEHSSGPLPNGRGTGSSGNSATRSAPQSGTLTPPARQDTAPAGRSQLGDEPPEEPLPKTRRYENDDTKPFPLARGEKTKSVPAPSNDAPAPSSKSKATTASAQRPNNDPRAANNSTSGNNVAKMKRRYLMPRAGIGLEKSIPIRIASNRVVIGGEFEIPVDATVRTESLIDRVLMTMDRLQSGWPSAGEGYHWVPTIKYEVLPGGEQVHQRLNSGLFDLGLASSVEYLEVDPVGQVSNLSGQKKGSAKRPVENLPRESGGAR